MRGLAQLTAAAPVDPGTQARLVRRRDAAPVAWRPAVDAVYLVGTAASPVGDDDVGIEMAVETGAALRIRSTAASVVWASRGTVQSVRATVADGASLDWHLEPMIATQRCRHRQHVSIALHGSGRVRWTEELVLGRHGEAPGQLDLRIDVDLDGAAVLRHQLRTGGPGAGDGPAVLGSHSCVGLVAEIGLGCEGTPADGPGWARMPLEGPGTLTVALATDLHALRAALSSAGHPT